MQNFISGLGIAITILESLEMCFGNSATVTFFLDIMSTLHSRCIDIIFMFIIEKIMEFIMSVEHTPT